MSDLDVLRSLRDQVVPPPLDALRETARRRTRRDAAAVLVGSATAVATVAAIAILAGSGDPDASLPPVQQPDEPFRAISYADGAVLHYGDRTVEAAGQIEEVDLTDYGATFRTSDGRIWFTDGSEVEQLGELGEPGRPSAELRENWIYLELNNWVVSGNLGPNVAWFEFPRPDTPEVVVYNTLAREIVTRTPVEVDANGWAAPHSVDDQGAYWFLDPDPMADNSMPQVRLDLATGEQSPMTAEEYLADVGARPARTLMTSHAEVGFKVYEITQVYEWNFEVGGGRIEPQGGQPLKVRDGLTGANLRFDAPEGFSHRSWFSHWLDDDTVVLVSASAEGTDLLECRFSTGACEIAVTAPPSIVVPEFGRVR